MIALHPPLLRRVRLLPFLLLTLALVPHAASAVPPLLNYQGFVTDGAGPMTGNQAMTFEIFADSTGGSALWSESYAAVAIQSGVFNVLLGSVTPLPVGTLLTGNKLWLQTTVGGETLLPRRPIVSVAYALRAEASSIPTIGRVQGYIGDSQDNGLLAGRSLTFTKKYSDTGLRVAWSDNFRVLGNNTACRWQVFINGSACTNPGGLFFDKYEGGTSSNRHDPSSFFGTCFGIPAGPVTITTRVGPTPGYGVTDCWTGWNNQLFSIEVQEVR